MLEASDRRALAAGGGSYLAVVCASQAVQLVAGITTATPLLPTLLGACTVGGASAVALRAADAAGGRRRSLASTYACHSGGSADATAALAGAALHVCFGLGVRFWALSPSSLAAEGAFAWAAASLPAGEGYASTPQREALQRFGRLAGCHSCGTRFAAQYVGDHVPPLSVASRRPRLLSAVLGRPAFRFYPQCRACSAQQAATMNRRARDLPSTLASRAVYHLPSPLRATSYVGVAVVALALAAEADVGPARRALSIASGAADATRQKLLSARATCVRACVAARSAHLHAEPAFHFCASGSRRILSK
jgi:hypothetical protein